MSETKPINPKEIKILAAKERLFGMIELTDDAVFLREVERFNRAIDAHVRRVRSIVDEAAEE